MNGAVIYDLAMRLPLAVLMLYNALFVGRELYAHLFLWSGPRGLTYGTTVASLVATEVYLLLVAAFTLVRLRPVRKLSGVVPRITALAAGLLPASIAWLPKTPPMPGRLVIGTLFIIGGMALAVVSIGWLGKSFSVMPEARRLITSGPYRLVRHPVYLATLIQGTGIILIYPSIAAVLIYTVEMILQVIRMGYEERVLRDTFPEYDDYARRTSARLVPRLY
ncbi:isoprenylcysteine carboxylmethyltransferase family protein [Sorangium sp. So ce295]|jgi:protein-S-isoprenylcysteine O-methyltransferase Ste14|uniref:methyltransferase family protein n=1 Tax=unclassified Sorangium TaxID=2621164 RepID=UPI003F6167AC